MRGRFDSAYPLHKKGNNVEKISEDVKNIIEGNVAALASVDHAGQPRAIAVGDIKVLDDGRLLIGDIFMERTSENIRQNPNISLAVWNAQFRGFTIVGKAEFQTKGAIFDLAVAAHPGYEVKGAVIITIEEISMLKG